MSSMPTEPLRPEDVDALLAPNVRTTVADLLSARDSLLRARVAFERLAVAVEHLRQASVRAQSAARTLEAEVNRHTSRELETPRDARPTRSGAVPLEGRPSPPRAD
jgi:hypothetical protein